VPTVADFRRSLIGADVLDIVDTFLLSPGAAHVSDENLNYIANSLAATYGRELEASRSSYNRLS
jgi:hypothetical protein